MSALLKNFLTLIFLPILIFRRIYYWNKLVKAELPGKAFAEFGFQLGKTLLGNFKFSPKLILNPVSIVRYFEFDFVNSYLNFHNGDKILDVSSPYLFGFYSASKYQLEYNYINPDKKDLTNVSSLSTKLSFKGEYIAKQMDVLNIPFPDNFFDKIISISVIEHIKYDGDSKAVKEIWRTLKPGGLFSFTVPVKKFFEAEYRNRDEYNLNKNTKSDKYFFQRIYNNEKIEERLLSSIINYEIIQKKIFGAKEKEFYSAYKQRWMKFSYWETVKDPYYISTEFQYFNDINELPDVGVFGITIKKVK